MVLMRFLIRIPGFGMTIFLEWGEQGQSGTAALPLLPAK